MTAANAEVKTQTGMITENGKIYFYNGLGQKKQVGLILVGNGTILMRMAKCKKIQL